MKKDIFSSEFGCKIEVNKNGDFKLTLKNIPHPTDDNMSNTITAVGRTLGSSFFNMGHHLMLLFEDQAPGFLDSVVAEVLYPEPSS